MIIIASNNKLGFTLSIGQDNNEIIDGLTELFIKHYGREAYTRAKVILVTSENFFHAIKNAYHLPAPYELITNLEEYILRYTDL